MTGDGGLVTFDHSLQAVTAVVAIISLLISIGAFRRSGPRVKVRIGRAGYIGPNEDPDFAQAIVVNVWNRGDAPVTIEHWGFNYCSRFGVPTLDLRGRTTGLGAYSVERRKGDIPHRIEPGDPRYVFATPLADLRRYAKEGQGIRAYVVVGNRPRRVRDWRFLKVKPFALIQPVDDRPLLARALRRKPSK